VNLTQKYTRHARTDIHHVFVLLLEILNDLFFIATRTIDGYRGWYIRWSAVFDMSLPLKRSVPLYLRRHSRQQSDSFSSNSYPNTFVSASESSSLVSNFFARADSAKRQMTATGTLGCRDAGMGVPASLLGRRRMKMVGRIVRHGTQ